MRSASGRVESVVNTIETGYTNIERSLRSEIGFCVGMQLPMEMPSVLNRNVSLIEIVPSICLFIHVGDVTPTHALARSASALRAQLIVELQNPLESPSAEDGGALCRAVYFAFGHNHTLLLAHFAWLLSATKPHFKVVRTYKRCIRCRGGSCWPADPFFLCHPCAASPWSALAIGAAFR
jgi:hypothetical protein